MKPRSKITLPLKIVIQKYNDGDKKNIELEIRFRNVERGTFESVYKIMKQPDIKKSISYITELTNDKLLTQNLIRETVFDKGIKVKEGYIKKTVLIAPHQTYLYKVVLSREEPVDKSGQSNGIIRVKTRASVVMDLGVKWRVDITRSRQIKDLDTMIIMDEINKLRGNINIMNDDDRKYEIELELINDGNITEKNVVGAYDNIISLLAGKDTVHIGYINLLADVILKDGGRQYSTKSIVPIVRTLDKSTYNEIWPVLSYMATDKADGIRAFGVCEDGKITIVTSKEVHEFKSDCKSLTIVDGEYLSELKLLAVFDVIMLKNENITHLAMEKRIEYIKGACAAFGTSKISISPKRYEILFPATLKAQYEKIYMGVYPYKNEGLIISKPGDNYLNTLSYKWKTTFTIDFLLKKCPPSLLVTNNIPEKKDHTVYILFVSTRRPILGLSKIYGYNKIFEGTKFRAIWPIQWAPSDMPNAYIYQHPNSQISPGDKIVEMQFMGTEALQPKWKLIRIRDDRQIELDRGDFFGNSYHVAELIWLNYMDPFGFDELWRGPSENYFVEEKLGTYRAQTAFISYIKSSVISSYLSGKEWVIDIGFGKGQDYWRYSDAHVKNVIGIDKNRAALTTAIRRRMSPKKGKFVNSKLLILVADIRTDHNIAEKLEYLGLKQGGADGIVSNLTLHYLLDNSDSYLRLAKLCLYFIKKGGIASFIMFSGERVHEKFKTNKIQVTKYWNLIDGDTLKYSLRKEYVGASYTAGGSQTIGVLLPFSKGEYYIEYLVDIPMLIKTFAKVGFATLTSKSLSEYLPDFKSNNPTTFNELSGPDKEYIDLYHILIFKARAF